MFARRILGNGNVGSVLAKFGIAGEGSAFVFLDLLQHFKIDAVGMIDAATGVGHGNRLCAELIELLYGVDGHVAGTGHGGRLAFDFLAPGLQHVLGEVHVAEAGGFGTGEGAAPLEALAGEHAFKAAGQALVLAEKVTDFAAAHADVTGGNVAERADVADEFSHEGLAEAHDFSVGLALGVKVGTALAAADGQTGEAVLENLFEAEELQNALVYAGMETQAALVRSDGGVELHAVAVVHLNAALIVGPGHTEFHEAFRNDYALKNGVFLILGFLIEKRLHGEEHFFHGLQEFRLMRILGAHVFHDALHVTVTHGFLLLIRDWRGKGSPEYAMSVCRSVWYIFVKNRHSPALTPIEYPYFFRESTSFCDKNEIFLRSLPVVFIEFYNIVYL